MTIKGSGKEHVIDKKAVDKIYAESKQVIRSAKIQAVKEIGMKWFTEFGHLNRGDMLTSEQHRCHNEKKKFQRRV
ncbi:hypothetical protein ACN76_27965 [Escherichia coli]|nr:hypothetical protein ACN76_27965 [Escherichia coli]